MMLKYCGVCNQMTNHEVDEVNLWQCCKCKDNGFCEKKEVDDEQRQDAQKQFTEKDAGVLEKTLKEYNDKEKLIIIHFLGKCAKNSKNE